MVVVGALWNWAIPGFILLFAAGLGGILVLLVRNRTTAKPRGGLAIEARV